MKAAAYHWVTVTLLYHNLWDDGVDIISTVPTTTGVLLDNSNGTGDLYNK